MNTTGNAIQDIFGTGKALIGMIHVRALPGTPKSSLPISDIIEKAVAEALVYEKAGYSGLILENMHDRPYVKCAVGPEVIAGMTAVACEVNRVVAIPTGIQVLAGANCEALAVAQAAGCRFIRVEGFVFAHVADEGWIDGCAGELMRYRKQIGAEDVRIFADIKKKHSSHAVTADVDLLETAKAAEFFLADGVIVSGAATGQATNSADLQALQGKVKVPVLVGSGLTADSIADYTAHADGFIVGSSIKHQGLWSNDLDELAVKKLATRFFKP